MFLSQVRDVGHLSTISTLTRNLFSHKNSSDKKSKGTLGEVADPSADSQGAIFREMKRYTNPIWLPESPEVFCLQA